MVTVSFKAKIPENYNAFCSASLSYKTNYRVLPVSEAVEKTLDICCLCYLYRVS